ncbi:hypothetical protein [Propioniciclava soli]|uniref:hypothetical protein n=1 Tax=Propioniciclava soli TaxID=2775081 RepID=UPI001E4999F0|nr:hypothetical protein [Propioniciclava soli]
MKVLVVDAANVVGSVPDGWWRDRAGAARRLVEALASRATGGDPVLAGHDRVEVVLEGRARAGVPESDLLRHPPAAPALDAPATDAPALDAPPPEAPVITVVHAPSSGDDAIVDRCAAWASGPGNAITLATADRGLIERVRPYGVTIVGPRAVR